MTNIVKSFYVKHMNGTQF